MRSNESKSCDNYLSKEVIGERIVTVYIRYSPFNLFPPHVTVEIVRVLLSLKFLLYFTAFLFHL
jgi:hypothetical protein